MNALLPILALTAFAAAPRATPPAAALGPEIAVSDPSFQETVTSGGSRIAGEVASLRLDGRSAFLLHDNHGLRALLDGDTGSASESFSQAIKARPDYQEGYDHLALTMERDGDAAGAANVYSQLMERWPANAAYYAGKRAGAYLQLGRPKEAFRDLEAALAKRPGEPHLLLNAALALLELGRSREAGALFEKAMTKKPALLALQEGTCRRFIREGVAVPACAGRP